MQHGCGGVALWTGEIRITMTFWNIAHACGLVAQNQNQSENDTLEYCAHYTLKNIEESVVCF